MYLAPQVRDIFTKIKIFNHYVVVSRDFRTLAQISLKVAHLAKKSKIFPV